MGCHGGALYGCSPPSPPSSPPNNSSPHPHHSCHGGAAGGGMATDNTNGRCHVCVHTCPHTTQPYMGTNNVFVIPAAHVQQQQQQQQQPQAAAGLAGANNLNNINMFLNGLGLALGGASNVSAGCGGGGLNLPPGFGLPGSGAGVAQVNLNNGGFSCAACCNHFRM